MSVSEMRFTSAFVILLTVLFSGQCIIAGFIFAQSGTDVTASQIEQLFTDSDNGVIEQLYDSDIETDEKRSFLEEDFQTWQKHCGSERSKKKVLNPVFRQVQEQTAESDPMKRAGLEPCSMNIMQKSAVSTDTVFDSDTGNISFIENSVEFASKSDDEQIDRFREIFEAVMAEEQKKATKKEFTLEIDGMVLDETRSKTGRVFYDLFYSKWQMPADAENVAVRITERIFPGSGSMIAVEVNQNETFSARLRPVSDMIEQAVDIAIQNTHVSLANAGNYAIY